MDFVEEIIQQYKLEKPDAEMSGEILTDTLKYFDGSLINEYYLFLKENATRGVFFSKKDTERIALRHIYECLVYIKYLVEEFRVSRETRILDAGSGPGLPGFLFYTLHEKPGDIILVDSSRRKLSLLEEYCKRKQITGITFIYRRIEETRIEANISVARALIPFPFNAVLLRHTFKDAMALFSGKAEITDKENELLEANNLMIQKIVKLNELDVLGERNLILISKKSREKKLSPVTWKSLQREMEKWHR